MIFLLQFQNCRHKSLKLLPIQKYVDDSNFIEHLKVDNYSVINSNIQQNVLKTPQVLLQIENFAKDTYMKLNKDKTKSLIIDRQSSAVPPII